MCDEIYKKNYDFACSRLNDFYNYLIKLGYKADLQYSISYASYFNISELNQPSIFLKDLKCLNNSISISTYLCESKCPFYIHLWFYNGGDFGHHFKNVDISYNLLSDDDFFFKYVLDYINEFMPFKHNDSIVEKKQMSIFDFMGVDF